VKLRRALLGAYKMARDDFSQPVKTLLAKRAGYLCSNPLCRVLTMGPSLESTSDVACVGIAAHIVGASLEGPRFDASMTNEQRSSIDNGIWLCATHATLIDRDLARFTMQVLHGWKTQHETYVLANLGESQPHHATARLDGKPISDEAARIAGGRATNWPNRLFAQLIRDEIKSSAGRARDLYYRIALGKVRVLEPDELFSASVEAMSIFQHLLGELERLLGTAAADGVRQEDPDLIGYAATRFGDIYRRTLDWGLEWIHTRCAWAETHQLLKMLPMLMSDVLRSLERFSDDIDTALDDAQLLPNQSRTITLSTAVPQELADEINREYARLSALIEEPTLSATTAPPQRAR
jgi:hypothetical protein